MEAPNCLTIMALLAEMARCVNQNIAKVKLAAARCVIRDR